MHVPELIRMGADISLKSNMATVEAFTPLTAAPVMCTDLRASAALVNGRTRSYREKPLLAEFIISIEAMRK